MRRVILIMLIGCVAQAQEVSVTGKVTYISSGTVYVSAGRGTGLRDSALVYVVAEKDTVAAMKVFAVSSKSSACTILRSKREVVVGDVVVGRVTQEEKRDTSARMADSSATVIIESGRSEALKRVEVPAVSFLGRVSLQYYTPNLIIVPTI